MKQNTFVSIMQSVAQCKHGEECTQCCWLWTGQVSKKGYGKVSYEGEKRITHSLIFKLRYKIPLYSHCQCLHTCDVPLCCNWNHIYIGDTQQNLQDKLDRNRQAKGNMFPQSFTNASKVYQMRRNYHSGGWTIADLCYVFGLSYSVTHRILKRQDWSYLQGELTW